MTEMKIRELMIGHTKGLADDTIDESIKAVEKVVSSHADESRRFVSAAALPGKAADVAGFFRAVAEAVSGAPGRDRFQSLPSGGYLWNSHGVAFKVQRSGDGYWWIHSHHPLTRDEQERARIELLASFHARLTALESALG